MWIVLGYNLCETLLTYFVFNGTATTKSYTNSHTLSQHDALPISPHRRAGPDRAETGAAETPRCRDCAGSTHGDSAGGERGGRNSRARAELRSAGHEARSDRRAADCEPQQGEACEQQGHSLLDHPLLVPEFGRQLRENSGSGAESDGA